MLHLQLLGPLVVRDDDGNDVTPAGARERNGLATLAIVSPEGLSTERIAAELYREMETADPRNAVQAMISRLRRALGRDAGSIETTANGYRLVDLRIDLDDAERELHAATAESDPPMAAQLLETALDRWNGQTLEGLSGELIETERLRVDDLRADAEDGVLERRVMAGHETGLVAALEAAVRDQPLREKRWELLMRTLYQDGRQADALRAFQRARSLLSEHLGLEPGPSLNRVEQQILAHDPALDRPETPEEPGSAQRRDHQDPVRAETSAAAVPGSSEAPLPSGTVSIVLCDVEGSVKRWESEPTDTAREIAKLHEIWAEAVAPNGGHLIKSTGDGVMAAFTTAAAAILGATEAMQQQNEGSLLVKVAIHTGSLQPVDDDYRGPVVNRCARLLDLANGGQILASGTTADLAKTDLAARNAAVGTGDDIIALRDLGPQWLRDVSEPFAVWQVNGPGIRSNFPPLAGEGPPTLPRLRSELLGRTALIAEVTEQVDESKLVTLLGPGGIGKTSMALAVGWQVSGGRPLTFVDLARVSDPSDVVDRMLEVIAGTDVDQDRQPLDRMADRLRANTDLVVIDNAEHVLDAVAAAVDHMLQYELKGSFLITSRQPLGLPDEVIVGIPPLDLPEDGDDLGETGRSPSVKLFVDRAQASRPGFEIQSGLLPIVAHICRRLDGIPLAIELAAGRASLLSIDDIAARLDDQLRLLRQVRSNRDRRHQSLEVVVGWSVEQLSPEAREVFGRLSVMAGSFGMAGVETMLANCDLSTIDVLEALDELHEASLISVEPGGSRFRMLEPIRQVASAELAERNLELETKTAHATWLVELVLDAHERRDESRGSALAKVDDEADQLRASITWIADTGQRELAGQIALPVAWWFLTRDAVAGERFLTRLLSLMDRDEDELTWALAVLGLGIATAAHPESAVTQDSVEAVAILDKHDHPDRGLARLAAAYAQTNNPDPELPIRLLSEAERIVSSDDRWATALVDMGLMVMESLARLINEATSDPEPLISRGQRAATVFRQFGEDWALGATLGELGRLFQGLDRFGDAEECYVESLELFADSGYHGVHYVLTELGRLSTAKNDHLQAEQYHRESIRQAGLDGSAGCMAMSLAGLGHAAEARGELELSLDLYRQALETSSEASLVEHGHLEWREAISRLEAAAT